MNLSKKIKFLGCGEVVSNFFEINPEITNHFNIEVYTKHQSVKKTCFDRKIIFKNINDLPPAAG